MQDLSKTKIRVNDDIELVVPCATQIEELIIIFQDPKNIEFIGRYTDWPYSDNLKEKIQDWIELTSKGEFVFMIILVNSKIAGTCRIVDINSRDKKAALGYIILEEYSGHGLATGCVKALLEYSYKSLQLNRIYLEIDPRNKQSIRLAEKLNFTYEGTLREDYKYQNRPPYEFSDWQIWSMLKSEYKS